MYFMTSLFQEGIGAYVLYELSLPGGEGCLVEFSKGPELTSSFPPFSCACFNPEANAGILIAHILGPLYLLLCISALRSLAALYLLVP